MELSHLILSGEVNGVKVGYNIDQILGVDLISVQDVDIPALYEYNSDGYSYQLTILDGLIIGIDFDLAYYPDELFTFNKAGSKFQFSYHTGLNSFLDFFDRNEMDYVINNPKYESQSLTILESGTKLYFDDVNKTIFRIHNHRT